MREFLLAGNGTTRRVTRVTGWPAGSPWWWPRARPTPSSARTASPTCCATTRTKNAHV